MTRANGPRAPGDRGQKDSIRGKVGAQRKQIVALVRDLLRRHDLCADDAAKAQLLDGFLDAVARITSAGGKP